MLNKDVVLHLSDMIEIAKAGYSDTPNISTFFDYSKCTMMCIGSVFRLYESDVDFVVFFPRWSVLCIDIQEDFAQFTPMLHSQKFNHLKATMKLLDIISKHNAQLQNPSH